MDSYETPIVFPQFSNELLKVAAEVQQRLEHSWRDRGSARLYFAHGLTGVSPELLKEVEEIKCAVENDNDSQPTTTIDHFFGLGPASCPEDIVSADVRKAIGCDLLVGVHVTPSYGAGGEIHLRCLLGLPMLFLYPRETQLTRMISGAVHYGKHVQVSDYVSVGEAVQTIYSCLNAPYGEITTPELSR